jgi:hypothetical protein
MFNQLPSHIFDFISEEKIGHLSVMTREGALVHPIAYYCDGESIVFGTPKTSAKMKFLQKNPKGSFTVDNGKLMKESLGVTVEGEIKTFNYKTLFRNLLSATRSTYGFHKKYPDLLKTYVGSIEELSDHRKSYKYVFNRLNPSKVTYWEGPNLGIITSKISREEIKLPEQTQYDPVIHAKQVLDYYNFLESTSTDQEDDVPIINLRDDLYIGESYQDTSNKRTMDVTTLLSLPEKLRKVGIAVLKVNGGTVDEIAEIIGDTRTEVKNSLDHLTLMKLLIKKREKNQIIYQYRDKD